MKSPKKQLRKAREKTFEDGSRRLVVVIGSGLHHHLSAHGVEYSGQANGLKNWSGLLRTVFDQGLKEHSDPTSSWESMLIGRRAAHENERESIAKVERLIREATPKASEPLRAFGRAVRDLRFRDLVTLNFDATIEASFGAIEQEVKPSRTTGTKPALRQRLRVEAAGIRIWHPHGLAKEKVTSRGVQLGFRTYAKAVGEITRDIESFREWQRLWCEARGATTWTKRSVRASRESIRRMDRRGARWWEQLMTADVAFIGCSLDRAELDLWLVLHERQRQLAKVPDDKKKPKAFFLHPAEGFPSHVLSGPTGLIPVVTRDHDEAWELLFGKWWCANHSAGER